MLEHQPQRLADVPAIEINLVDNWSLDHVARCQVAREADARRDEALRAAVELEMRSPEIRLSLGTSDFLTEFVYAVNCGQVSPSRAEFELWFTVASSGYTSWISDATKLS